MAENKNNAMGIVIDDGSQRVPITNKYGDEIGIFYFRPTDLGIVERFNQSIDKFTSIVEPLADVDIEADGTASEDSTDAQLAALHTAEEKLYELVNYVFGGDMAGAFFGKMHPFSPIGGVFYCELALDAVGKFISSELERETAQYTKRIEKYTKGYTRRKK